MPDTANDVTIHGYPPVGRITQLATGSQIAKPIENLPIDQFGGVDMKALRARQLRSYSTAELEAELKRRSES